MRMRGESRQRSSGSDAMAGSYVRSGSPCQLAVSSVKLPLWEPEIDCKLQSNSPFPLLISRISSFKER
jgi:hypothetical protein